MDERIIKLLKKGISKWELAKKLDLKPSELESLIKELEEKGYVFSDDKKLRLEKERVIARDTYKKKVDGVWYRFGVISDTHYGSLWEDIRAVNYIYQIFKEKKIRDVYHCGDLVDGDKMRPGHEYELRVIGYEGQLEHIVKNYPRVDGITTYFILGDHDYSFIKNIGADIGKGIERYRDDMKYLGIYEADVIVNGVVIRLQHPAGSKTAYALSYKPQKYIESLTGGEKPNIVLIGHYHKVEYLFYRNVHAIQAGCIQRQTRWMRGKNIAAMRGAWIVNLYIDKKRHEIVRIIPEFIPLYK